MHDSLTHTSLILPFTEENRKRLAHNYNHYFKGHDAGPRKRLVKEFYLLANSYRVHSRISVYSYRLDFEPQVLYSLVFNVPYSLLQTSLDLRYLPYIPRKFVLGHVLQNVIVRPTRLEQDYFYAALIIDKVQFWRSEKHW